MYSASCFLRNKFSAATWACDRAAVPTNRTTSARTRRSVRAAVRDRDRVIIAAIVCDQPAARRNRCGATQSGQALDSIGKNAPRRFFADDRERSHVSRREKRQIPGGGVTIRI